MQQQPLRLTQPFEAYFLDVRGVAICVRFGVRPVVQIFNSAQTAAPARISVADRSHALTRRIGVRALEA